MTNTLLMYMKPAAAILYAATLLSGVSQAATITDPGNDFLSTYLGPKNGDLDVLSAEVTYDGSSFTFTSNSNGNIGFTPGGFFVWGIDRGAGTARFGALAPGVVFDSVVILTPGGTSTVRDLIGGAVTNLAPADVSFSGGNLSARVSAALLPSEGAVFQNYTVNLWPRLAGGTDQIADFAPNNSNALVSSTPEPATFALMGGALLCLGAISKRRSAR